MQAAIRSLQQSVMKPSDRPLPAAAPSLATAGSVSDDMLGFVTLARLASGAPAVRDIGAFAWSQLRHLAPGSTLALFTVDDSRTTVVSRYIAGAEADRIPAMTILVGERITGWVDANAALDLGTGFEDTLRYALSMPLVGEGGIVGVLTLYAPQPFGDQLALTVEMIGPHLARAVTAAVTAEVTGLVTAAESVGRSAKRRGLSLVSRASGV
jgi:hypothetical protein